MTNYFTEKMLKQATTISNKADEFRGYSKCNLDDKYILLWDREEKAYPEEVYNFFMFEFDTDKPIPLEDGENPSELECKSFEHMLAHANRVVARDAIVNYFKKLFGVYVSKVECRFLNHWTPDVFITFASGEEIAVEAYRLEDKDENIIFEMDDMFKELGSKG